MNYLTDLEKVKIETFCKDADMFNAVKKVLLEGIYTHGVLEEGVVHDPLQNAAFHLASVSVDNPIPDEIIGQHTRGMFYGINALVVGFRKLQSVTTKPKGDVESPYNEAV